MARKICIFTGTRAEFSLLRPLLETLEARAPGTARLLATSTHLSPEFGLTRREIEQGGFIIDEAVEMLLSADTPTGVAKSMGLGLMGYAEALTRLAPDILVLLGDRFEACAAACAATVCKIPIAHIHGGEITQGAIDEVFRHAITKMSHLHFTSTEVYRQRVIQMGEQPDRVFNVGALGVENILALPVMPRSAIEEQTGLSLDRPFFLVTFHPATADAEAARRQIQALLDALDAFTHIQLLFTKANADAEGRSINQLVEAYLAARPGKGACFDSLGGLLYLNLMRHCQAVVGNSSSGIIEAPTMRVPTVDIGDRQKGRLRAPSVLHCAARREEIEAALARACDPIFRETLATMANPYEKSGTAVAIATVLFSTDPGDLRQKMFHDQFKTVM